MTSRDALQPQPFCDSVNLLGFIHYSHILCYLTFEILKPWDSNHHQNLKAFFNSLSRSLKEVSTTCTYILESLLAILITTGKHFKRNLS